MKIRFERLKDDFNSQGRVKDKWSTVATVRHINKSALDKLRRESDMLVAICESIASTFRAKILSTGVDITVQFIDQNRSTREMKVNLLGIIAA